MISRALVLLAVLGVPSVACIACSGATASPRTDDAGTQTDQDSGTTSGDDASSSSDANTTSDASTSRDSSTKDSSSSPPPPPPPPPGDAGDGTPTRQSCTGTFGTGLTQTHGRLDGLLVAIVGLGGTHACNGDSSHGHLQVLMSGSVYDVAVNTDTLFAERDLPLPDGAWSEGWHANDALDYAALGLHSSDFAAFSAPGVLAQRLESELATVNHISVFATGYGPDGAHLVHRNGGGRDGAIVAYPLSSPARLMMYTFSNSNPF